MFQTLQPRTIYHLRAQVATELSLNRQSEQDIYKYLAQESDDIEVKLTQPIVRLDSST